MERIPNCYQCNGYQIISCLWFGGNIDGYYKVEKVYFGTKNGKPCLKLNLSTFISHRISLCRMAEKIHIVCIYFPNQTCQDILNLRFWQLIQRTLIRNEVDKNKELLDSLQTHFYVSKPFMLDKELHVEDIGNVVMRYMETLSSPNEIKVDRFSFKHGLPFFVPKYTFSTL